MKLIQKRKKETRQRTEIERALTECRKPNTKTKVNTLANHKGHSQYNEPIKTKVITLANHKGHRQYSEPIKTKLITLANHKGHRKYDEPIRTRSKDM